MPSRACSHHGPLGSCLHWTVGKASGFIQGPQRQITPMQTTDKHTPWLTSMKPRTLIVKWNFVSCELKTSHFSPLLLKEHILVTVTEVTDMGSQEKTSYPGFPTSPVPASACSLAPSLA